MNTSVHVKANNSLNAPEINLSKIELMLIKSNRPNIVYNTVNDS